MSCVILADATVSIGGRCATTGIVAGWFGTIIVAAAIVVMPIIIASDTPASATVVMVVIETAMLPIPVLIPAAVHSAFTSGMYCYSKLCARDSGMRGGPLRRHLALAGSESAIKIAPAPVVPLPLLILVDFALFVRNMRAGPVGCPGLV